MNRTPHLATRRAALAAAGATALGALPAIARAQAGPWPTRAIRLVVPYTAGGFTDQMARLIQPGLQQALGQPVVVDNKPGANSVIGVDAVAKAPGDGYTFGVVIAAYAANPSLYPKLPFNQKKDLTGVSLLGVSPLVAATAIDAPFKTVPELIAYARANPGKVSFGSSGAGSSAHLSTELLKLLTHTDMRHVPYKGSAPALADLMGGQIPLYLDPPTLLVQPAKAGRIRLIGIAADKRLPLLPDVPTFIEQGVPGFTGSTWAAVIAPAATPREIVQRVSKECARIVHSAEARERLDAMGTIPEGSTPEACDRFIAAETAKWARVVREAKVTLE